MGERDYAVQMIQHLTGLIRANAEDRRSYFLRGNAYLDRGEFSLAIEDFTRAIELDPQDPVAYNNRGIAHRSLVQTERAIEDYRQALALDVHYRDAYDIGIVVTCTRVASMFRTGLESLIGRAPLRRGHRPIRAKSLHGLPCQRLQSW
jgi:tetratricopeptide (TPR) repeat protein